MKNVNTQNTETKTINPAMAQAFSKAADKMDKPIDSLVEEIVSDVVDEVVVEDQPIVVVDKAPSKLMAFLKSASAPLAAGIIAGVGALVKNQADRKNGEESTTAIQVGSVVAATAFGAVAQVTADCFPVVRNNAGLRALSSLAIGTGIGAGAACGVGDKVMEMVTKPIANSAGEAVEIAVASETNEA